MKKILVVDDAKLNRELLQDMLNNDYIVETGGIMKKEIGWCS